ncbi:YdbL family protein [Acidithiobacillus sp.]|uniref:YdbL family protein n=1 Tax=Acidithiobacillus sp. TaxID=1872118 RepID=UPI003CFE9873
MNIARTMNGRHGRALLGLILALALSACVTVNIYFPAAAAQKLADKVVEQVYQAEARKPAVAAPGISTAPAVSAPTRSAVGPLSMLSSPWHLAGYVLNLGFSSVSGQASAAANLDASSPEVVAAKDRLEDFVPQIRPYLQSGAVGFTAAGLVAVRDLNAVPLAQRAQVSALVATNNTLLQNLYQAIANANGHPEWEAQIQATFAQAWINKAPPGRWFQNSAGQWQQK